MQPEGHRPAERLKRLLLGLLSLPYKSVALAAFIGRRLRQNRYPGLYVVSADGLAFGGSGKTPLVMAIGAALEARQARFAIVSRGYRSRLERRGGRVEPQHDSAEVGDEPMLLKRRFPRQDVFVGRDRRRSIARAAAAGHRIIILDDGFQSSHIGKDYSIMLLQPGQPYYYLRHFRFLARCADRVLHYRRPGKGSRPRDGVYDFVVTGLFDLQGRRVDVGAAPLAAFSALGDNRRFASDMGAFNLAAFRSFPDHHAYTAADLAALEALRAQAGARWLVCTEKDLCKLAGLVAPGAPLLQARNEIQLPRDILQQMIADAETKGFL